MFLWIFVIQEFGNKVLSIEHKLLAVVGCAQSIYMFYVIGLKTVIDKCLNKFLKTKFYKLNQFGVRGPQPCKVKQ